MGHLPILKPFGLGATGSIEEGNGFGSRAIGRGDQDHAPFGCPAIGRREEEAGPGIRDAGDKAK